MCYEMEVITEGRHFRLVKDSELPDILNYLEQFLPESIKFYQTIKTYLNYPVWQFYFYVSKTWPKTPIILHFPGLTLTPNKNIYESVSVFCPLSQIELVDILEMEDILIDWKKPLCLNFTHKAIMNRLKSFYSAKGDFIVRVEGDIYIFNKDISELDNKSLLSDDVEMRPLTTNDIKVMYDFYLAKDIESIELFENIMPVIPGFGIFKKNTNELAAWLAQTYYGAMFAMQTKPEFRKNGYGKHLAQSLTKLVAERGYLPFVIIRPDNYASQNLYKKIGYEKAYEAIRGTLTPADNKFLKINNDN